MKRRSLTALSAVALLLLTSCGASNEKQEQEAALKEASQIFEQQFVANMNSALDDEFSSQELDDLANNGNVDDSFINIIGSFMEIGASAKEEQLEKSGEMKSIIYNEARLERAPIFSEDKPDDFTFFACLDISEVTYGDQSFMDYTGLAQDGMPPYDMYRVKVNKDDRGEYFLNFANTQDEGPVESC